MVEKRIVFNATTGETTIEEVEVQEIVEEIIPPQPTIEERVNSVEEVNNTQDSVIDTILLANDEMFTMLEPILEAISQQKLEKGVSRMVDMYVCMVQRELKTVEQVPVRYREEVRRILTELEK